MLTDKELELVMMELETESISPETYRYHTKYGFSVVYYMFNIQKLEKLVFEPVYFYTDDVECLGKSEEELFQIILRNTVVIMQTKIIPYSSYLAELGAKCHDVVRREFIARIVEAMERSKEEDRLWCLTSIIRERGASGVFCTEILKQFCKEHHFKQLFIGVSNNDFAFLYRASEEMLYNMQTLVKQVSHVVNGEDKILQRKILLYDYETDTLEEYRTEGRE